MTHEVSGPGSVPLDHDTVRAWYAAIDARDADAMCGLAHPRIVVAPQNPLLSDLPGTTFHGRTGVLTLMRWVFDTYPSMRLEALSVRDVPGFALAAASFIVEDRPALVTSDVNSLLSGCEGKVWRVYSFASESAALAAASRTFVLTPREREVFQMVASGMTVRQIADELTLSPATVRTHVRNGIARIGASNKVHAVSVALTRGELT